MLVGDGVLSDPTENIVGEELWDQRVIAGASSPDDCEPISL